MLLVRSLERAERILKAMKCRGFDGRLHTHDTLTLRPFDAVFAGSWAVVFAVLLVLDRA
jgi:cobalt/nickel transport system permease protein